MSPRLEALTPERSGPHDLIGSRLGAYLILGRLGAGGMGEVYEAQHEELGRRFALKVLRAELKDDKETQVRFYREPRAVAQLVSEHIVSIVDCGELPDGRPYFVMERLYGSDLRRLLNEQGILPVARVAHLGVDACRGLACAHRAGLVHRDLKPENLFLTTRDDGQDRCQLLDFGVVKSTHDNTTRPGALLGTTRYMAPEQLGLELPVSPQTDLYALGVILYECLTGRGPFEGDTVERILFKIMTAQETPIQELRPEVPAGLAALVSRALSKKPDARPESALAFAEALLPYTRSQTPGHALSSWHLQVADERLPAGSDRDLTPQAPDRETLLSARQLAGVAPRARGTYRPALGRFGRFGRFGIPGGVIGLGFGLVVGAVATLLLRREAPSVPPETRTVVVSAAQPATATTNSALASPAAPSLPSAAVPQDSARAAPGATSESSPSQRGGRRKPLLAGSSASAPPAASFDPHNPYAP